MPHIIVDGQTVNITEEEAAAMFSPAVPSVDDVNAEHDRRAMLGKVFAVNDYGNVALEGSLRTQTVLLALKDTARDLIAASITAPLLRITDRDNVTHTLTAEQMVDLVDAGKAYMQDLHEAKIALKAMNPIPAEFAADQWWPA